MAMAPSPFVTSSGATTTTFLTTTMSLSSDQPSFTILFPPLITKPEVRLTTFAVVTALSSTYTPSPLLILVLTNVVGIAVNPSNLPIATRTLSQIPSPRITSTSTDIATTSQAGNCHTWNCWSRTTHIGICAGAVLGALLLFAFLVWWLFIRHPRIKKIRIRSGRPSDEEKTDLYKRSPLKISVKTMMPQTRSKNTGGREESPTPPARGDDDGPRVVDVSPAGRTGVDEPQAYRAVGQPISRDFVSHEESPTLPPPTARGDDDRGRVVAVRRTGINEPQAYRIVRHPSPRGFIRPVSMPVGRDPDKMDGTGDGTMETRDRNFATPMAGAATGAGMGNTIRRGRRGSVVEGDVSVSRGESIGAYDGSRRSRREIEEEMRERSERRRDRQKAQRPKYGRKRSQSHTHEGSKEHGGHQYGEMRRYGDEEELENRRSRYNYVPRGEENFEGRRDRVEEDIDREGARRSYNRRDEDGFDVRRERSPRRRERGRSEQRSRPRSVSHDHQDDSNNKQRKRRSSESEESGGLKAGLKKLVPLLPLVLGLMTTYAEPKGGWDQYIPEEKRKGKGKLKKMAEDVFDKHHHKIPEDFPRHLYNSSSKRSKSADPATHRSSHQRRRDSPPPPPRRRDAVRDHRERSDRKFPRPASHERRRPECGSFDNDSEFAPSPPPRRHRSKRERRIGGYDGADDDYFVVYPDEIEKEKNKLPADEVVLPHEISEPDPPNLKAAKTFPLSREWERWEENRTFTYATGSFVPHTPPSIVQ